MFVKSFNELNDKLAVPVMINGIAINDKSFEDSLDSEGETMIDTSYDDKLKSHSYQDSISNNSKSEVLSHPSIENIEKKDELGEHTNNTSGDSLLIERILEDSKLLNQSRRNLKLYLNGSKSIFNSTRILSDNEDKMNPMELSLIKDEQEDTINSSIKKTDLELNLQNDDNDSGNKSNDLLLSQDSLNNSSHLIENDLKSESINTETDIEPNLGSVSILENSSQETTDNESQNNNQNKTPFITNPPIITCTFESENNNTDLIISITTGKKNFKHYIPISSMYSMAPFVNSLAYELYTDALYQAEPDPLIVRDRPLYRHSSLMYLPSTGFSVKAYSGDVFLLEYKKGQNSSLDFDMNKVKLESTGEKTIIFEYNDRIESNRRLESRGVLGYFKKRHGGNFGDVGNRGLII